MATRKAGAVDHTRDFHTLTQMGDAHQSRLIMISRRNYNASLTLERSVPPFDWAMTIEEGVLRVTVSGCLNQGAFHRFHDLMREISNPGTKVAECHIDACLSG